jgi:hypothetical protein
MSPSSGRRLAERRLAERRLPGQAAFTVASPWRSGPAARNAAVRKKAASREGTGRAAARSIEANLAFGGLSLTTFLLSVTLAAGLVGTTE